MHTVTHTCICVHVHRYVYVGLPCASAGKESACNVGDLGSIPGLGRSPGEGKGYPLQYSGLENTVHGVTKSLTRLSDVRFHVYMYVYMCIPLPKGFNQHTFPPLMSENASSHTRESCV